MAVGDILIFWEDPNVHKPQSISLPYFEIFKCELYVHKYILKFVSDFKFHMYSTFFKMTDKSPYRYLISN